MKYEVKKLEKSAVEVKLHLDAAEVSPLVDKVLKHVGEHAEVAGFRKGHAPKEALMANYKDHIESDVANDAINAYFPEIVEKEKLEPVSYVRLKEIALKDELDLTFDIDVYPEFTLGNYKGLEAEKKTFEMTDDLLNTELEMMQRNHSKLVEVEDASYKAQLEDTVDLAFEGFMDGVPFPGGKAESHLLKLGSKSFIDNFEEQLVGYTKGQEGEITVKFPEEYHAPELAGKPEPIAYPHNRIPVRHYGKMVFDTLNKIKDMEPSSERDELIRITANHMKSCLEQYGHGSLDDERIASDMAHFTEGQVQLDVNAMPLKKNSAKVVNEKKRKKR